MRFRVHYQPIVSLQTGKITGFEALSRWQRPEGIVPPIEFIAVAQEIGLIVPMNRRLVRGACQHLRTWQTEFLPATSDTEHEHQLPGIRQLDLASGIRKSLEQTGVDPGACDEMIETIAMGDAEKSRNILSQLKALGVGLSIDDFGAGYSSLGRYARIQWTP